MSGLNHESPVVVPGLSGPIGKIIGLDRDRADSIILSPGSVELIQLALQLHQGHLKESESSSDFEAILQAETEILHCHYLDLFFDLLGAGVDVQISRAEPSPAD